MDTQAQPATTSGAAAQPGATPGAILQIAMAQANSLLKPQDLDPLDRKLLTLIQKEFPLSVRPYASFGEPLGISEEETLRRIQRLKEGHILRQIGAIFDTRRLGYQSSLVAVQVDKEKLDQAAAVINEHPGVSHNYGRNHAYNLWYTIALPPGVSMEETVAHLHRLAGAKVTRLMPTLRLFKIGVRLDVAGESKLSEETDGSANWAWKTPPQAAQLNEGDIRAIRALQEDLPVVPEPFGSLGSQEGLGAEALLHKAQSFLFAGIMRRYAGVLHHRSAGFVVNGMGVWKVPLDRIEELGTIMGAFRGVTHCYQRPTYEDWPYTIFTMIHARTGPECKAVVEAISEKTGITEYAILYSTKEYKKIRVKYFTRELEVWAQKTSYMNAS